MFVLNGSIVTEEELQSMYCGGRPTHAKTHRGGKKVKNTSLTRSKMIKREI